MKAAFKILPLVALSLAFAWSASAVADPPAHAPAHGWRKKHHRHPGGDEHDDYVVGYSGERWEHDYDILSGRCNREAVAAAVGGVVGGVIASRVSKPENRAIATLLGAAAGALVGKRIGHALDEADRGCFGQTLEVGRPGEHVVWTNDSTGVRYEMVPGTRRDRPGETCREFTLLAASAGDRSERSGIACAAQPGAWQIEE